jgi:hypothetical protein
MVHLHSLPLELRMNDPLEMKVSRIKSFLTQFGPEEIDQALQGLKEAKAVKFWTRKGQVAMEKGITILNPYYTERLEVVRKPTKKASMTTGELMNQMAQIPFKDRMASGGIRISTIKEFSVQYEHKAIDEALLTLEKNGSLVIYHFDDPTRITKKDRELGLVKAGCQRHYVFIR